MWTPEHIQKALRLETLPDVPEGQDISVDSRTITKGDIFLARTGQDFIGDAFIPDALKAGAVFAITEKLNPESSLKKQIQVPSAQKALEMLGQYARKNTNARVIALAGSQGKTTVKEFLAFVLKEFGNIVASRASYNNYVGVPLSLTRLRGDTDYGVFEIGMNNPGEILPLAMQICPHISIITNIGEAHIGLLGSVEAIAEEKSEVISGLQSDGTAILPMDCAYFPKLLKKAKAISLKNVYTFGKDPKATAYLEKYKTCERGTGGYVTARIDDKSYPYTLSIPGEHSACNSLIVLLTAKALGLDLDKVVEILPHFNPIQGRGQRHYILHNDYPITLIDDAYNANPSSMRAGLSVLATTKTGEKGRRIAVLGDMKELGAESPAYHKSLSLLIQSLGIDLVFAAGDDMKHLYDNLPKEKRGGYTQKVENLIPKVFRETRSGDVIFVKGSKSSYISKVVDAFLYPESR